MISGLKGKYHSDPIFSRLGILKINDLYRQQLRVHAWRFIRNKLPENQAVMLNKVSDVHRHNTRSSSMDLYISSQDHRSIGYRIPREWQSLPKELKDVNSLGGLKRKSKEGFISTYKSFSCVRQGCFVCASSESAGRNAVHDE